MIRTRLAAGLIAAACLSSVPVAAWAAPDNSSSASSEVVSVSVDQHRASGDDSHGVDGGPKHEWPFCRRPIPHSWDGGAEMVNAGPKHEWPFRVCAPRMTRP